MKAFKLTGLRQMALADVPDPVIAADTDVLVKMASVGVCGSDVHYYKDGKIGTQVVEFPWTVGHEGSGVVEQIGAAAKRVRVGDRIAFDPLMPCWKCDQCLAGRPHTCRNIVFLGCPQQAEGCLSEYIALPETSCFPIPPEMTFNEATLSEPLSIGLYAAKLASDLRGAEIGILGAGPIGLCVLLAARTMGVGKTYVTDKIDARLKVADQLGADWVGSAASGDAAADLAHRQGGQLDVVFECCGQQEALDQAVDLLKPGGELALVGIPQPDRISFNINSLRRKEIRIRNVRRQNGCVQRSLDMIAHHEVNIGPLVTHRFPFSETDRAFDLAGGYRDGVVKAMIEF